MPFCFNGVSYPSAIAMTAELETRKKRLHAAFGCDRCDPLNSDDADWLWTLIGMHRRADEKITDRVRGFAVRDVSGWTRGVLHVILLDETGSAIPNPAKEGKPAMVGKDGLVSHHFRQTSVNERRESLCAFRRIVSDQIEAVRRDGANGAHVGHGIDSSDPFGVLVVKYLQTRNLAGLAAVKLRRVGPESGEFVLEDAELAKGFYEYHAEHAKMAMQDATVNLKLAASDKRRMRAAEESVKRQREMDHWVCAEARRLAALETLRREQHKIEVTAEQRARMETNRIAALERLRQRRDQLF